MGFWRWGQFLRSQPGAYITAPAFSPTACGYNPNTVVFSAKTYPSASAGPPLCRQRHPAIFDVPLQLPGYRQHRVCMVALTGLSNPSSLTLLPSCAAILPYTVTVTDVNGCTATDDVFVKYMPTTTYMPGAFTPNGDGIGDILKPLGFGLKRSNTSLFTTATGNWF